ncbi:hypothetical protein CLROS_040140 [Clostridium felsineum]|uniref:Uncharacterized protein n=1 Tax=Clostridium felsineum TaxID=36839 RepID=A0A1S8MA02_9CLOT|nr:hypothetical protein CLROS_040140 [Clostridium felsineum]URZ13662.1 hypothetical protein CROST_044280 [Clostridium felsineum]
MNEGEMDAHLGYEPYEQAETTNSRNGKNKKKDSK